LREKLWYDVGDLTRNRADHRLIIPKTRVDYLSCGNVFNGILKAPNLQMCELLGMSANTPTDICFSFSGLMQRSGGTAPHKDGWGVAFYQGRGIREFRDPYPVWTLK
jgi:hypothetical protein